MKRLLASICWVCMWLCMRTKRTHFSLPGGCTTNGENISSTENWTCLWYDLKNLTCSFDLEQIFNQQMAPYSNNSIVIFYTINGFYGTIKQPAKDRCVQMYKITENYGNCTLNLTLEFSDSRAPLTEIIQFNNKRLAKLSPVKGVQYNTTTSSVAFHIPLEWIEFEREIRIRYRSEYDRGIEYGWKEVLGLWKKDYNLLFKKLLRSDFSAFSCNMNVVNLTAFTSYDILIDIILCVNGSRIGYWTDLFSLTIRTDDDVPIDVPKLFPGYFMHVNRTAVQIYWNPIPLVKRCGIITAYRLTVNKQKEFLSPKSISHTVLISPNEINKILLTQRTRHGYPKVPDASIYIYPDNQRPNIPKIFTFEKMNHTHVLFTWSKVDSDDAVTSIMVVWCRGTLPGYCSEPLHSKSLQLVSNNVTAATVALQTIDYLDYIYGISVEALSKEKLIISSGIRWYMDCIYHRYGIPTSAPIFNISYYSHSTVLVKWKPYTCEESVGEIEFFMLKYCKKIGNNCTGPAILVKVQPDVFSYELNNLEDGCNYILQLGTKLKHGAGPWSKQKVLQLPKKKKSGKTQLLIGTVAGGVSASIVLLLLTVCFCRGCIVSASDEVAQIDLVKIKETTKQTSNDSGLGGSAEYGYYNQLKDSSANENQPISHLLPLVSNDDDKSRSSEVNSEEYQDVRLNDSDEDYSDNMFIHVGSGEDDTDDSRDDEQSNLFCENSSNDQTELFEERGVIKSPILINYETNHLSSDDDADNLIDSYSKEVYCNSF